MTTTRREQGEWSSERTPERSSGRQVAFLGPAGSYSNQATRNGFGSKEWELVPTITIQDVFDAVQSEAVSYGVVPFENSTHGIVTMTLDNLADRTGSYPDLYVCGEVYLDVHHVLLGRKHPASQTNGMDCIEETSSKATGVPLTDLSHVKQLYSHPQGFGQTTKFVGQYLRGVGTLDVTSTSRAAELAAADPSGSSAAIASEMAAEMNGLDVLARCIEDRADNTTRFFVLRKGATDAGLSPLPARLERIRHGLILPRLPAEGARAHYKSLVSFTVPHHEPGALASVLDCFRRLGLSLTSINSVPSQEAPFQYLFFVEFEGSRFDDPMDKVKRALQGVADVARGWRFLGSWENQL